MTATGCYERWTKDFRIFDVMNQPPDPVKPG
jgi:hypothetical protein